MNVIKEALEELKDWLKERKGQYVEHYSMMGDTEGGFYSTDEFDFDKLCAEIDAFGEQLRAKQRALPAAEAVEGLVKALEDAKERLQWFENRTQIKSDSQIRWIDEALTAYKASVK